MTYARKIGAIALCGAFVFCGGELVIDQPPGSVGDDGGYVLPDGAPVFQPGSGCAEQPTTPFPACNDVLGCTYGWGCTGSKHADECVKKASAALPPAYPFYAACQNYGDDPSLCAFNGDIPYIRCGALWGAVATSPILACHVGLSGDAFCSAYMNQFVLGNGSATAQCVPSCNATDTYDGMCWPTTGCTTGDDGSSRGCESLQMCVTRNGQAACEPPCMPPP